MDLCKRKACIAYTWLLVFVIVNLLYNKTHNFSSLQNEMKYYQEWTDNTYEDAMSRLNDVKANVSDPNLISLLKNVFIHKPSTLSYNLTNPNIMDPSPGQAAFVDNLLNHKTNGFFIECGASSGEHHSNTLFLERYRNWTGILIEANPTVFKELTAKHRKAFSINACLSVHAYPSLETLFYEDAWTVSGNIVGRKYSRKGGKGIHVQIQCFPLYSILLAFGQPKIDYFSLDIEGAESGLLKNLPWDKIDIELFSIEYQFWRGGKQSLKSFMEKKGYMLRKEITKGGFDIVVQKQHK